MSQIEHLLQTAEAIRRDGKPEWMQVCLGVLRSPESGMCLSRHRDPQVTGLLHDLGKLLLLFGSEGQWDVVGVSLVNVSVSLRTLISLSGHFCRWMPVFRKMHLSRDLQE